MCWHGSGERSIDVQRTECIFIINASLAVSIIKRKRSALSTQPLPIPSVASRSLLRAARVSLIVIPGCLFVCLSVAGRASGRCCCCVAAAGCCVAAIRSRRDSGSRQTLLVLQFVIEFANIRAQYSPSTYASTHFGFF